MGYLSIDNLPRIPEILNFRRGYALEKVHGTSAHVSFKTDGTINFFSGGEKHVNFVQLFNEDALREAFKASGVPHDTVVFGEAYGGRQQRMAATYGKELRFIVFDIKMGDYWLDVPSMARLATTLGFEVVPWSEVDIDLKTLDALRDAPSEVAIRRGCGDDKKREGIVIRPLIELRMNNGDRVIAKHKGKDFEEVKAPRAVGEKVVALTEARAVADNWCTYMRLNHVLDKQFPDGAVAQIEHIPQVIRAMIEDIKKESDGEIVWSKDVEKAIGTQTVKLFKEFLDTRFREEAHG